jgi:broad specificity phosphatase PhoE
VIVFVRHGQTDANHRGLLLGHADPSLSDVGHAQAAQLAVRLGEERAPIAVVSSPLQRTMQTAAVVARAFGLEVEPEPSLIELDYGEWDERPFAEVPRDVWLSWQQDCDFTPPGGESLRSVQERVSACTSALLDRSDAGSIVAVSHVSPIKAAAIWALGLQDRPELAWRLRLDVASITRVIRGLHGPVLSGFNQPAT